MYRRTHAASHFGKKVVLDGFKFDSLKEATFYQRYIKPSGYSFMCQQRFTLLDTFTLELIKLRQTAYKADFVVYDEYSIDKKSKIKFSLFARKFKVPVEVVVLRPNHFDSAVIGTTKRVKPVAKQNIDYDWQDLFK